MTDSQHRALSHEGARRKEAIRAAACRAAADRRRGVQFFTSLAVLAVPLVLVAAIWSQMPQASSVSSGKDLLVNGTDATRVIAPRAPHVYQNVQYAVVQSPKVTVDTISDDELLELLARAGRPSGLIRMAGHVQVVEHARAEHSDAVSPGASGQSGQAGGA
jgi:hypothetical protein